MTTTATDYPPAFPFAIYAMTKRQFLHAVRAQNMYLLRARPTINPLERRFYVAVISYSGRRAIKHSIWQVIGTHGVEVVKPVDSSRQFFYPERTPHPRP